MAITKKKPTKKKTKRKKAVKKPNPVGRPPIFKSVKRLQDKIDEYFKDPPRKRKIYSEGEVVGEVPIITITGLVLYLGFSDRHSFYTYEKKKEFSYTIKRARSFIEVEYEEQLKQNSCTGAIFALKNFGWTDKREVEMSGNQEKPLTIKTEGKTPEELINILRIAISG